MTDKWISRGGPQPGCKSQICKGVCLFLTREWGTEVAWYGGYRFCDDVHRRLRQSRQHLLRAVKSSCVRSEKITKPTLKRDTPNLSVLRNWQFGAVNKKGRTFVFRFSRLASGSEECPLRGCADLGDDGIVSVNDPSTDGPSSANNHEPFPAALSPSQAEQRRQSSLNSCEISYARFDLLGQIQKRRDVRCYRLRFRHCRNEVTHSEGGKNLAPVAYGNTEGVR